MQNSQKTVAALHKLYLYNLLVGISLTVVTNFAFFDLLLLKLDINLAEFGLIKSIIYLLPAVIYPLCQPLLQKIGTEAEVCGISYILRVFIPLLLPAIAVFCQNRQIMTLLCLILLPLGMLFATFANNTLMILYRKVIPSAYYNLNTGIMNMLLGLPSLLLALPAAKVLDCFMDWEAEKFFLLFATLHLITFLFEIPACLLIRTIKLPLSPPVCQSMHPLKNYLRTYKNAKLRTVILLGTLQKIIEGLIMSYLTIYFLQVARIGLTNLICITTSMGIGLYLLFPLGGKFMDKLGYSLIFTLLSGGMLLGMILFCIFWETIWILPFFAVLTWDGNCSLFGGLLRQGVYSAVGKLASPNEMSGAVATYSLCTNGGLFIGLTAASGLFYLLENIYKENLSLTLKLYYTATIPLLGMLFYYALKLQQQLKASPKHCS